MEKKPVNDLTEKVENTLQLADRMAIERTKLSNERTFLSYLRTMLALLGGGLTIIRLDVLRQLYDLGIACLILAPIILAFAIFRFIYNRRRFNRFFTDSKPE